MAPTAKAASTRATPRKLPTLNPLSAKKPPARPNSSILSFFKKVDKDDTESLFVNSGAAAKPNSDAQQQLELEGSAVDDASTGRFNEDETSLKRRRLSSQAQSTTTTHATTQPTPGATHAPEIQEDSSKRAYNGRPKGPFVMDSDSEDDDESQQGSKSKATSAVNPESIISSKPSDSSSLTIKDEADQANAVKLEPEVSKTPSKPSEWGDFPDSYEDGFLGEEFRERKFMEEQARLEAGDETAFPESCETLMGDSMVEACPICDKSLLGVTPDEATKHVNSCLDGNFDAPSDTDATATKNETDITPKIEPNQEKDADQDTKAEGEPEPGPGPRALRAAVPRPGQANPFSLDQADDTKSTKTSPSAFTKLMSGHAEDAAWANAAAAENSSRGKQAYERTCPFYKIMPGFFICVDAFRYGAVQGCNAYFLSHFHSDHYIGLTSKWSYGPIYCSKVTGGLVKQQLRVAAKWVVELEFDSKFDIPGTEGASVTMIPANHCPGSSLFLFEKTLKQGPGSPGRTQRILHCGDFRACPAHIKHPLLKPNIEDSVTQKLKQQKIDICYLDTTYLNPRYSFPPQNDVIRASAELCANMSPDPQCKMDFWDKQLKENPSGGSVSKFFTAVKSSDDDASIAASSKASDNGNKPKQRLLVICGTYSIGKERICVAIAKALNTKIYATAHKLRLCSQLDDPELSSLMTSNPLEAQVHMQMLMEIRAETLQEYLDGYKPHFSRIVGFRPSGWSFKPSGGRNPVAPNTPPATVATTQILHGPAWHTRFAVRDFVPQRGSTREAICFGVPYSEHSSFRELALFLMSLRIERVVPTVNVGSDASRKRMKAWTDRWLAERRRGGLVDLFERNEQGEEEPLMGPEGQERVLWTGKDGAGGGAWW